MTTFTEDGFQKAEILSFKITNKKWIKSTIEMGEICLGCADFYSHPEEGTGKRGQYDKDEGIFARIHKDNVLKIKELERLYGNDLVTNPNGDFLDFKLKSVINMPIYCFYSANASQPDVGSSDKRDVSLIKGVKTFELKINKKVFHDFCDDDFDNFGMMIFLCHSVIRERIEDLLKAKKCTHVCEHRICYVDRRNKGWCCPEDHPNELFYKDISFSHQKEVRIIVKDRILLFPDQKDSCKKRK
jgi:hypothetical protein